MCHVHHKVYLRLALDSPNLQNLQHPVAVDERTAFKALTGVESNLYALSYLFQT